MRRLSNHVSVVTVTGNRLGKWKMCAIAHENGGKKHEKHEFLRSLSSHVTVVTLARNRRGNWKMRAISQEMDRKHKNCEL